MKLYAFAAMIGVLLAAGCGQSIPECGSEKAKSLVKDIIDEKVGAQYGSETAKKFSYSLKAIRTQATDEENMARECAAELVMEAESGDTKDIPIVYTVELTDDGESIYVTVYDM